MNKGWAWLTLTCTLPLSIKNFLVSLILINLGYPIWNPQPSAKVLEFQPKWICQLSRQFSENLCSASIQEKYGKNEWNCIWNETKERQILWNPPEMVHNIKIFHSISVSISHWNDSCPCLHALTLGSARISTVLPFFLQGTWVRALANTHHACHFDR